MNAHRERRQIALLFSVTSVILVALWVFGLRPARERAEELRRQLDTLQKSPVAFDPPAAASNLEHTHARLRRERTALQAELQGLRIRTRTFTGEFPNDSSLPSTDERRIDYKVARLEARSKLFDSAAAAGMNLPDQLGLQETIEKEEKPKTRLWQLAAVVKSLQACMTVGVPTVRSVRPLPPLVHGGNPSNGFHYREFPVLLRMTCSFESAILFLQTLQQPGHFFTLRGFMMENVSTDPGALLEVLAIPSADLDLVRAPIGDRAHPPGNNKGAGAAQPPGRSR